MFCYFVYVYFKTIFQVILFNLRLSMVGYSKDENTLSSVDYMLAGATAGFFTRFFCQPLDVVKIRFQLQVEPVWRGAETSKYRSNLQAIHTIFLEEGVRGLWKGHNPGQILSMLYGIGQFGTFEVLTQMTHKHLGWEKSSRLHFFIGSVSGVVGTLISYPFDVIRTRFVAQGNNLYYRSMLGGLTLMFEKEGAKALFKGLTPTLLQVAPHAGAQFAFYHMFSNLVKKLSLTEDEGSRLHFVGSLISGSLSGVAAKTVIYPFDLTRKRLEFQGFQTARTGYGQNFWCEGMVHCFVKTYTNEGVAGLFKGLSPSLLKAGATSALHFAFYEQTCRVITNLKSFSVS